MDLESSSGHESESTRILGLGIGVIVLLILWVLTVMSCAVLSASSQAPHNMLLVGVFALLATLMLVLWPREDADQREQEALAAKVVGQRSLHFLLHALVAVSS